MSETIRLVQGDTYTPVKFEIKDEASADIWEKMEPMDLSEISKILLKFKSLATGKVLKELVCEFVYETDDTTGEETLVNGIVQVKHWLDTLSCEAGSYQGELETHRHDGTIQSVQNTVKFKVRAEF